MRSKADKTTVNNATHDENSGLETPAIASDDPIVADGAGEIIQIQWTITNARIVSSLLVICSIGVVYARSLFLQADTNFGA